MPRHSCECNNFSDKFHLSWNKLEKDSSHFLLCRLTQMKSRETAEAYSLFTAHRKGKLFYFTVMKMFSFTSFRNFSVAFKFIDSLANATESKEKKKQRKIAFHILESGNTKG